MTGFVPFVRRWPDHFVTGVAAILFLSSSAFAQNAETLANLKGYGLQQYLNGNRGGSSYPSRPSAHTQYAYPQRSVLQVTPIPYQHAEVLVQATPVAPPQPKPVAYVQAHLPIGADLYINDKLMVSNATLPSYDLVSPELERGKSYTYTVLIRWVEDGKWVGQMHTFDFKVGDIHHMEVTPSNAPVVLKEIAANLAKLDPADRAAAEKQKVCVVQDTIKLGSMGVPVKVKVDGKDLFLCCEGCKAAALKGKATTRESENQ